MSYWGTEVWGSDPWSGVVLSSPVGDTPPIVIGRRPFADAIDVLETTPIRIEVFDRDDDFDLTTLVVTINGDVAYDYVDGFRDGYLGRISVTSGVLRFEMVRPQGWNYSTEYTVKIVVDDSQLNSGTDTWKFTTRDNPVYYSGLTPTVEEQRLLQPFTSYVSLELLRAELLNNVVTAGAPAQNAARVIYQLAYSTELHTLLNSSVTKDTRALQESVRERRNVIDVDRALLGYKREVRAAMRELNLPKEYQARLTDYLDSTMYNYRVSLIATLVLIAASSELSS